MKAINLIKTTVVVFSMIIVGVSHSGTESGWKEYSPVGNSNHYDVASIPGEKGTGVCMLSPSTKVTFYFNKAKSDSDKPVLVPGSEHGIHRKDYSGHYGYEYNPDEYYAFVTTGTVKMKRISPDECRNAARWMS